ncbi:MAG TPA: RecQ family ATP-dependent DNA helicase [Acidimicrobiales bacterium]|nr:RecQ family ATP-dependent DNA helicase [Acidimicrobiales bacterium]
MEGGLADSTDVAGAARRLLGYDRLLPGQEEAVAALLGGHDVLAVMPTGGGKSAVYQLAGALVKGTVVVISPLLALQRDQVAALDGSGLGAARVLNSDLSASQQDEVLAGVADGSVKFLFAGPEQLQRVSAAEALFRSPPALVAVDEAHCVCSWGHDFRPDYRRLAPVIEMWDHPRVVALTATASPPVREEIVDALGLRRPVVVVAGFDRPNIGLAVEHFAQAEDKDAAVVDRAAASEGCGLVYAATRRRCEELAGAMVDRGVDAVAYHAGLGRRVRHEVEQAFMGGAVRVVVATTAFGMGVDKPDVRFVLHADVADSLDSYYQEIGRAGRDGDPAAAVLFFRSEDLGLRRFFAGGHTPEPAETLVVLHALRTARAPLSVEELEERVELSVGRLESIVAALERAGAVEVLPGGAMLVDPDGPDAKQAWLEVEQESEAHARLEQSRVDMMRAYADTRACRRHHLLGYFGEPTGARCGNCDNCLTGVVDDTDDDRAGAGRFPVGATVLHGTFGRGEVLRRDGDEMVVFFSDAGYRTLSERLVVDNDLLRPAPA